MSRTLMILGSGETSPTMVTPHQRVFAALGRGASAALIDSPYGFQENADELTERIQSYFRDSVGREVAAASFRTSPPSDAAAHAEAMALLRSADWVFAGPGSPSYALRVWQDSAVPEILHERLRAGGAVVFASAAALTLGAFTVPVYEIYKVGERPRWLPGLDVLGRATGLLAAVVPHWNNAEGGTHDTRFCYLGERRLRLLEAELPAEAFVLGVDEHTGAVIDLDSGDIEVVGRGVVTFRKHDQERTWEAGSHTSLDELAGLAGQARGSRPAAAAGASANPAPAGGLDGEAVRAALQRRELGRALALVGELDRRASDDASRSEVRRLLAEAANAAGEPVDATAVVAPFVDLLLRLRDEARAERRWAESDAIRDGLAAAGLEVRDTPDGTTWELRR